jgi:NDP-sugar pyrophosphorylase family protein
MKILIPMAGEGSRFAKEGYTFPKPLIDVNGKPMIQVVVENLDFDAEYIFVVRKEHLKKYEGLEKTLYRITNNNCKIVEIDSLTEGAACTALLAKNLIDCDDDLLIANSDQVIEYSSVNFKTLKTMTNVDAIVFTFNSVHPKWSFVKTNSRGIVSEVAEKLPISDIATCGIYWYKKGSDFVKYAERMIEKNIRVNNEFYIAPVYNELILDKKTLIPYFVHEMYGIGTPEDLNFYLNKIKK